MCVVFVFFFSSRRRHTRCSRDWSSDVCSSDLEGVRVRRRALFMTSFAFILGCVPLWTAAGAGAVGRQILGTVVIGGMLTDTPIPRLFISVSFYVRERFRPEPGRGRLPGPAPAPPHGGANRPAPAHWEQ